MELKIVKDVEVICPHCKQVLNELLQQRIKVNGILTKPIYACGNCKSILPGPSGI